MGRGVGGIDVVEAVDARVERERPPPGVPGHEEGAGPRLMVPTVATLIFASGACALVYQLVWVRQLSVVFGVTVYAAATVLAVFFGGLALGSWLAGHIADRVRHQMRWYAAGEVLTGVTALLTLPLLAVAEDAYVALRDTMPDSLLVVTAARVVLSSLVLLVPTTLMGATMPVVVKSTLVTRGRLGERLSLLYATNTLGAIAGTLLAGFLLIGTIGITGSLRVAAVANVAVGALAFVLALRWERPDDQRATVLAVEAAEVAALGDPLPPRTRRIILGVFAVSGFTTLALEVVWLRVLVIYLETNTYAFTVMLTTVLAGIALGGFVATPLMRRRLPWLSLLAGLELLLAVVALLSLLFLARTYDLVQLLADGAVTGSQSRVMLVASMLAAFPATFCMGLAFPIGLRLFLAGDTAETGRRVGRFYAWNVAGGILGSLAAGFVLVPALGTRRTLVLLATMLLVSGLALLSTVPRVAARRWIGGVALTAFVLSVLLGVPDPYAAPLANRFVGEELVWREEGVHTTVSIQRRPDGHLAMYLDGFHQANDSPAMVRIHGALGALPLVLAPNARDALVIGLGGGVTAGYLAAAEDVDVEVVELSSEVVKGARHLAHANRDVLDRPNVRVRVDDGRNHVLTTRKRYDVITADLIPPNHAGAGILWSTDYWELTRDALRDDGIMVQWIGSRDAEPQRLIVRSFLSVFPHATLWDGAVLIGSKRPFRLDPAAVERRLGQPQVRAALGDLGVTSLGDLLTRYEGGPDELRRFAGRGALLTDDRPRLEYFLTLPQRGEPFDRATDGGDVRDVLP